jgi:hypothetical protein
MLSSLNAYQIITIDVHLSSGPSWNCIRPDMWLHIKWLKISAHPSSCMKCCTLTPKKCFCCLLLLHPATTAAGQMAVPLPEIMNCSSTEGPPLWSSSQSFWLLTPRSRVRFLALPDFLSSSGSGTGSAQPLWE